MNGITVKAPTSCQKNQIQQYARSLLKSQLAQTDGILWNDYQLLLQGNAIYLPHFFCTKEDFSILRALVHDLETNRSEVMINWSKHFKHENPDFSPTFKDIVTQMAAYFDVEVYATRLNFYNDNTSWKPFHHDSHAYEGREQREDFTMGVSFGDSRELVFLHPPSGNTFNFPQNNGDLFCFNNKVNKQFQHGVPKSTNPCGPRFSIIAWGRRRTLNDRNAGAEEIGSQPIAASKPPSLSASSEIKNPKQEAQPYDKELDKEVVKVDISQVTKLVEDFILTQEHKTAILQDKQQQAKAAPKKSRVQGGWGTAPVKKKQGGFGPSKQPDQPKQSSQSNRGYKNALDALKAQQQEDEDED